ncbi:MAG TPA: response regulator transcription factor, partial [Candidatus Methylomirabilis sp.]|nr:response regulator transcription factor [Candidatus Methylomirabilis sp.]
EATNSQEMLTLLQTQDCDVLVMDVSMPGRSGLDVLPELKAQRPKLPVLVLSMHPEDPYGMRALKLGAAGYLCKDSAAEELVGAIRKVVSGRRYISASLAERLAMDLAIDSGRPLHEILSAREQQVLRMIATGKSLTQIGRELSLSVQTISTYRTRILEKTDMSSNEQLIHYAIVNRLTDRPMPSPYVGFPHPRISPRHSSVPRSGGSREAREVRVAAAI